MMKSIRIAVAIFAILFAGSACANPKILIGDISIKNDKLCYSSDKQPMFVQSKIQTISYSPVNYVKILYNEFAHNYQEYIANQRVLRPLKNALITSHRKLLEFKAYIRSERENHQKLLSQSYHLIVISHEAKHWISYALSKYAFIHNSPKLTATENSTLDEQVNYIKIHKAFIHALVRGHNNLENMNESIKRHHETNVATNVPDRMQFVKDLLKTGKTKGAIQFMKDTLSSSSDDKAMRMLLMTQLEQLNRKDEEKDILNKGLQRSPGYMPYIMKKAKWLFKDETPQYTITFMSRYSPPIQNYPEFYALYAVANKRAGRLEIAAEVYKQLVSAHPHEAKWWFGLGLVLEKEGIELSAKEAYQHVLTIGHISPVIMAYARSKTHQWEGSSNA